MYRDRLTDYETATTYEDVVRTEPAWTPVRLTAPAAVNTTGYAGPALVVKRLADRVLSLVLLVACLPLLAVVAVGIRLTSPGPAVFRQVRVGRGGRRFRICKFRTMRPDAEEILRSDPELFAKYRANGFKLSLEEDPRITRLGVVLRRYSIDEIPQLWNVLTGDMSLVGPRPVLPDELFEYGPLADAYTAVFPGITGPWQVSGRDDIATHVDRAELIGNYVENWSLLVDARILVQTIPAALQARGVA